MLHKNRVALVTGAARGLGWGIARAFGIAGARVCVTDISDDELARCARDLAADGTDFQAYRSDVADLAECKRVVKTIVDRWGRLDVVVHNAIYMPLITFEATTPEEWSRQINVGIGGLFNCAYAVWHQMKAQGEGHIIGIASGSSIRGYKEEIAYCAIKHGVEGFVKALFTRSEALQHRDQYDRSRCPHQAHANDLGRTRSGASGTTNELGGSGRARQSVGVARLAATQPVQRLSLRRRDSCADHRAGGP